MKTNKFAGHLAAFFSILIWGTSFISTTKLLGSLSSAEIIICRFALAFILLNIIYPKRLKVESVKREIIYALAGICGVTLYFFLEIASLKYTKAANVSVLISTSPFFCAILSLFIAKSDKPKFNFFVGFVIAVAGIVLVTFENGFTFDINVKGAIFAISSAVVWGIYSLLSNEIGTYGHNIIASTRRIFMYGLIFMIPTLFIFDINPEHIKLLADKNIILNLLLLGVLSSGLCFVTWNYATRAIGPVKASTYIYLNPVVTIIFSYFFLKNQTLTWQLFLGAALIIAGLLLSLIKSTNAPARKKKRKK